MNLTNEQIESLEKFVLEVLDEFPDVASLDGGDIQEIGEKHKILVPQTMYAPCIDDGCNCAQYYDDNEFKSGVTCYRVAEWLLRDAEHRNGAERAGAGETPNSLRTKDQ